MSTLTQPLPSRELVLAIKPILHNTDDLIRELPGLCGPKDVLSLTGIMERINNRFHHNLQSRDVAVAVYYLLHKGELIPADLPPIRVDSNTAVILTGYRRDPWHVEIERLINSLKERFNIKRN